MMMLCKQTAQPPHARTAQMERARVCVCVLFLRARALRIVGRCCQRAACPFAVCSHVRVRARALTCFTLIIWQIDEGGPTRQNGAGTLGRVHHASISAHICANHLQCEYNNSISLQFRDVADDDDDDGECARCIICFVRRTS